MATQLVRANYQEVIDLHTEADHVTIIGIHTPTGNTPRKMFSGFFNQYKKFKYLGASIKLVPAARLPADPLQVSYPPGQVLGTNVDPRDMLNPLMFHGAHGEDMGTVLNRLFGDDIDLSESINFLDKPTGGSTWEEWLRDALEKVYYKALTDNSWKKANPQRGFVKGGLHPMVYSLATNRQILPGSKGDVFALGSDDEITQELGDPTSEMGADFISEVNKSTLELFTPRLTSLGWLDTRNMLTSENALADATSGDDFDFNQINYALLPKVYMGVIMLPPAYGVEQYFRMIINHNFAFKGFRGISFKPDIGSVPSYYNAEDLSNITQFTGEDHLDGNVSPNEGGSGGGGDTPTPDDPGDPTPDDPDSPTTTGTIAVSQTGSGTVTVFLESGSSISGNPVKSGTGSSMNWTDIPYGQYYLFVANERGLYPDYLKYNGNLVSGTQVTTGQVTYTRYSIVVGASTNTIELRISD